MVRIIGSGAKMKSNSLITAVAQFNQYFTWLPTHKHIFNIFRMNRNILMFVPYLSFHSRSLLSNDSSILLLLRPQTLGSVSLYFKDIILLICVTLFLTSSIFQYIPFVISFWVIELMII